MKYFKQLAVGLALSFMASGSALVGQASAHESHGSSPMMAPGYLWGSPGMTSPGSRMGRGYGGCPCMMQGPGHSQPYHGRQHGQHMGQHRGQHMGQGMMGYGHMVAPGGSMQGGPMQGGSMQHGMMGHGMIDPGAGMMPGGGFRMGVPLADDLTIEQVKHVLEHRLDWLGFDRLKVGEVSEQDQDVIVAEIVTEDGSLVQRLEVDRHTGWSRPQP